MISLWREDIAACFMSYAERFESGKEFKSHPDTRRYVDWIALTAGAFFEKYPHLLTDDVIELLAVGEEHKKVEQFRHLAEFHPLNEALKSYFDSLRPRAKKPYSFGFLSL
ncbi:hypothetical protein ACO2Q8_13995 [Larkinella sp. VNQ87]|uniref:hypothetical protein n=1 Tax=Larkinella sp. VNQ87 TaxID=3400921 RepID=UPI003C0E1F18